MKPSSGNQGSSQHSKKKKKRGRGVQKKFRVINVVQTGETPRDKYLGGGKVRKLDVLKKTKEDALPRKTRDLLRRMAVVNGEKPGNKKPASKDSSNGKTAQPKEATGDESNGKTVTATDEANSVPEKKGKADGEPIGWLDTTTGAITDEKGGNKSGPGGQRVKEKSSDRAFKGMQAGESYSDFMTRLNTERKQLSLDTARMHSHQRAKKKAHYEKRALGRERRKRRNRGELSSDEEGDDEANGIEKGSEKASQSRKNSEWDEQEEKLSQLPMYWQEIVQNNGRPISQKRRKRMERMERAADEKQRAQAAKFGDQVEAPPMLTSVPKKRGGSRR